MPEKSESKSAWPFAECKLYPGNRARYPATAGWQGNRGYSSIPNSRMSHRLVPIGALGFCQTPDKMAVFTIRLMFDEPENNSQVQEQRRQEEFAGHLRIIYSQRTAIRTMNRLFQSRRHLCVQQFNGHFIKWLANLNAKSRLWRTKKQKKLEKLVIIRPRINPFVS